MFCRMFTFENILMPMKRFVFVLTALLSVELAFAGGKIVTDTLDSKVLGRGVPVNLYIPEGFGTSDTTYPALYLLHGLYGNHEDWERKGGLKIVIDELIGTGEAVPMVVIMPCAGDVDVHNVQNGYFNMPGCSYEDFFFNELLPKIEEKYSCGSSRGMRAVAGLSMGGGGSVVYSQRHPQMFSSCYAMSAWLDNPEGDFRGATDVNDKLYIVAKSVREHSALDFIDAADDDAVAQMRTLKWFFDCGDDDRLLPLSFQLYMKMRMLAIPCELRVRNGEHNWEYWHTALRFCLPFVSRNFANCR